MCSSVTRPREKQRRNKKKEAGWCILYCEGKGESFVQQLRLGKPSISKKTSVDQNRRRKRSTPVQEGARFLKTTEDRPVRREAKKKNSFTQKSCRNAFVSTFKKLARKLSEKKKREKMGKKNVSNVRISDEAK